MQLLSTLLIAAALAAAPVSIAWADPPNQNAGGGPGNSGNGDQNSPGHGGGGVANGPGPDGPVGAAPDDHGNACDGSGLEC